MKWPGDLWLTGTPKGSGQPLDFPSLKTYRRIPTSAVSFVTRSFLGELWNKSGTESVANPGKCLQNLVSAAGFEPATHALKEECFGPLPCGFYHLRTASAV